MLGSPVEKGKALFELAPLDSYRLIIHVDERDVRYFRLLINEASSRSQACRGTPAADSDQNHASKCRQKTGRNSFRVEARLPEPDTVAARNGRRCENRDRRALVCLDLDTQLDRLAPLHRMEVLTVSARAVSGGSFSQLLLVSGRWPSAKVASAYVDKPTSISRAVAGMYFTILPAAAPIGCRRRATWSWAAWMARAPWTNCGRMPRDEPSEKMLRAKVRLSSCWPSCMQPTLFKPKSHRMLANY